MSKLSAVLPLNIMEAHKSNSCELVDVLMMSLRKFSSPGLFEDFFIICPPPQVSIIESHMAKYSDFDITVINEREFLPELDLFSNASGWRIQQLLKLAAANLVKTPFYLTFDADILCTAPISEDVLLPQGKALLQLEPKSAHSNWWRSSAHRLQTSANLDGQGISVTPALLATEVVLGLIAELSSKKHWTEVLLKPHLPNSMAQRLPGFKKRHRWTEYTLYFTYLEKHSLIDRYHVTTQDTPYDLLSLNSSLWNRKDESEWESWDPSQTFSVEDKGLFMVIQSHKKIPPQEVMERVSPFLE